MKSKEEILLNYYKQAADGQPEISADDLLKAMEEYRVQAEKAAFNAARQSIDQEFTYPTFESYRASLIKPEVPAPVPTEATNIQLIADSIFELFIPNDADTKEVLFDIKTEGKAYIVTYIKNEQGYWLFTDYKPVS